MAQGFSSGRNGLWAALAVMLGADVGTALMAVVFSFDLSWLSPLLIFVGVVLFISRQDTVAGRVGRVLYTSGNALSWDQRFTNYDGSQSIEAPAAADTHALTETPPCAAGQQANFRGFCQGPPA